jgi:hypothetical protein
MGGKITPMLYRDILKGMLADVDTMDAAGCLDTIKVLTDHDASASEECISLEVLRDEVRRLMRHEFANVNLDHDDESGNPWPPPAWN